MASDQGDIRLKQIEPAAAEDVYGQVSFVGSYRPWGDTSCERLGCPSGSQWIASNSGVGRVLQAVHTRLYRNCPVVESPDSNRGSLAVNVFRAAGIRAPQELLDGGPYLSIPWSGKGVNSAHWCGWPWCRSCAVSGPGWSRVSGSLQKSYVGPWKELLRYQERAPGSS